MANDEPMQLKSAFDSPTFGQDGSFRLDKPVGSASISPCGRDIALASRHGLHIIDLDSPWTPPRFLVYNSPWEVADVQWSPFAARDFWVVSTSNQKALVWNLNMPNPHASVEHVLHAHSRAISDINFSAHHPDILATCAVDSFVHCWDLRHPAKPAMSFCDWFAGATQVKWNRQSPHIIASSHDKFLRIWDDRKGAQPLRSIEAHETKIYGVDWNRMETDKLVTCSLDRTIKFWDYSKNVDKPESIIHTPFPVWRARHTPFGHGLLAMPQRGDNNLHLYNYRMGKSRTKHHRNSSVHAFIGHNDQVKEFLWRTRGRVTDSVDERDFQLVSWGADKVLRLHHVDDETFEDVGYTKGMNVKRAIGFTRRGAVYRSFRDDPSTDETRSAHIYNQYDSQSGIGMSLRSVGGRNTVAPSIEGKQNALGNTARHRDRSSLKDMDPITWMRGVRIGKRSSLPANLHESVSTITSPNPKPESRWDVFESLGEEITHVGERFSKIMFNEIDVSHRKLTLSLSGPWGAERGSTYLKIRFDFPNGYPKHAIPSIQIEKTTMLSESRLKQILADAEAISTGFLAIQRSSLETLVRYLIGEQSLDECLQSLQKHRSGQDIILNRDQDLSSSDEDDEDLGKFGEARVDALQEGDPMADLINAPYNVPLPRTCGAMWAGNGSLVCFFPVKPKAPTLLDHNLGVNERTSRFRNPLSEGFGRLNDILGRRKGSKSSLEAADNDDSGYDEYSSSSSDSSISSGFGLPQSYFLPAMGWHNDGFEQYPKLSLDESQKSSGETGAGISSSSKAGVLISIHALNELLPAKERLAREYIIGSGYENAAHNAKVALQNGFDQLARVWSFIELILQDKVPVEIFYHPKDTSSAILLLQRAMSSLRDDGIMFDQSHDVDTASQGPTCLRQIQWGWHPLGRGWLIDALFRHFERAADIQMLAMMSCIFDPAYNLDDTVAGHSSILAKALAAGPQFIPYYSSLDTALSVRGISTEQQSQRHYSTNHSAASSTVVSMIDHTAFSSENNTPPTSIPFRQMSDRRSSQGTSLSASPEHHRQMQRSSSNFSILPNSFSRSLSFTNSAASSPPNTFPKKRLSPSGSHLPVAPSNLGWVSPGLLSKASTFQDDTKGSFSLSFSDMDDEPHPMVEKPKPAFVTNLKNQDKFYGEGYGYAPLLDPKSGARYASYRTAYAHLLDRWRMPIARCELTSVTSSHGASTPTQPADLIHFGRSRAPSASTSESLYKSLQISQHCSKCLRPLPPSPSPSANSTSIQCSHCRRPTPPPLCALCHTYIRGLSSPCLSCGHVLHASCRTTLLTTTIILECPTGCGCNCTDTDPSSVVITPVSPPPLPPPSPPQILPPRPSSQNQPKEFEHRRTLSSQTTPRSTRDISPAITIIKSSGFTTTDDLDLDAESSLWRLRRSSDLVSPTSTSTPVGGNATPLTGGISTPVSGNDAAGQRPGDIAYESLARNLRVRGGGGNSGRGSDGGLLFGGGAGGGGAGGGGIRETGRGRGSQVWRGGGG